MFTKELFCEMLKSAAGQIEEGHDYLSALDEATGDGDHGTTILRTMRAIVSVVEEKKELSFLELLNAISMKVMMCDGGSVSPLLGSYFMGFAMAKPTESLDANETALFFEQGLKNMLGVSKADIGDKTMMDALIPATETLYEKLTGGSELCEAFSAAAKSADEGREKTKQYVAKFGRARTMGDRAIGHYDAGATSIALIFKGFAEACKEEAVIQ